MSGILDLSLAPFMPMPKIPRLHGDVVVTEKIDGTNACVEFHRALEWFCMAACSRNRRLVEIYWHEDREFDPQVKHCGGGDNYGFGAWVIENRLALRALGYGRHFGEWWGQGIQRGYGLAEKRFSLFRAKPEAVLPECVSVVPTLVTLPTFDTEKLAYVLACLGMEGSTAAPGFMQPEGIVAYHARSAQLFKYTFEAGPKGKGDDS